MQFVLQLRLSYLYRVGKNILEQIHLQLSFCWFDKRKSVRNVSSVKNVLSCLRT